MHNLLSRSWSVALLQSVSSIAVLLLSMSPIAAAQHVTTDASPHEAKSPAPLAERISGMRHMAGLLALDYDSKAGKVYLEVPMSADADHTRSAQMIYSLSLPHGAGSNDLGFDRGQIGGVGEGGAGALVYFERSGPRVLLMEPNLRFRSSDTDPAAQAAVRESFAESVMWGFKVEAEAPDGTVLLDATDFFVRDARGVAEGLNRAGQGSYKFDAGRSAVVPDVIRAFPKNIVVEAVVTLSAEGPVKGRYVREVTPDPRAVTVHERQMFVELPPAGYTPRRYSPRSGYFPDASYRDYNIALGESLDQNFINRHRLIKRDPGCTHACQAVEPIQYYVDRGAPEPIRSALVEGARWWDQAFQAAGWAPGTFKVDVLPADADPMDIRYNIIQWVHRYNRGWSYGAFIADPRTGEIIKGQVTLGSLRGRQDYLIAQALLSPYENGKTYTGANDPMLHMVLQRIRQLAAHETGHTLGLLHNFAASAWPHPVDQTASVMDYPHPYVTIGKDGIPDLSHAYPVGIGAWDKTAIDYGYREFDRGGKPAEDAGALNKILKVSEDSGMQFITDGDARPMGSAHPQAHLWDNGVNAADELHRVLDVRAAAMARFGEGAIPPGTDLAQLEDTFVPLYLFHRYQTEAATKMIGGLAYRYNVRGDGQPLPAVVPAAQQREALSEVLRTLSPDVLLIPAPILKLFPPRPPELPRTVETLPSQTSVTFDAVAAAESAADLTLSVLLDPARANRMVEYHAQDASEPSLAEVANGALQAAGEQGPNTPQQVIATAVHARVVEALLTLAANPQASSQVKSTIRDVLAFQKMQSSDEAARVELFLHAPEKFLPAKPVDAPPGMPIGDDEDEW